MRIHDDDSITLVSLFMGWTAILFGMFTTEPVGEPIEASTAAILERQ